MLGIVMCGGKSTRMGSDKGLLLYKNKSWAQNIFNLFTSLQLNAVVSVSKNQQEKYKGFFADDILIADNEALNIYGPLRGLLTMHLQYPKTDFMVLACDMQVFTTNMCMQILTEYYNDKKTEAFVYNTSQLQPLAAIYTYAALEKIYNQYTIGKLIKHSMQYALSLVNTRALAVAEKDVCYFENFNTDEDILTSKLYAC
jgi:molybdenum cofactor guanylyltransferase